MSWILEHIEAAGVEQDDAFQLHVIYSPASQTTLFYWDLLNLKINSNNTLRTLTPAFGVFSFFMILHVLNSLLNYKTNSSLQITFFPSLWQISKVTSYPQTKISMSPTFDSTLCLLFNEKRTGSSNLNEKLFQYACIIPEM